MIVPVLVLAVTVPVEGSIRQLRFVPAVISQVSEVMLGSPMDGTAWEWPSATRARRPPCGSTFHWKRAGLATALAIQLILWPLWEMLAALMVFPKQDGEKFGVPLLIV